MCLEESEKGRTALKGGVQGRTGMTRAAFYLPALNQEEEVPAESSEDEKSQPGANNNNKSSIASRKYGT